ncbi:MAG TPA: TadE/TadG family type IV pilus assembly protein [Actinomycetales bacterium]|nr:TadE/TadG family type IV pilus assembly protein [Actinomycetales bacterium]
MRAASRLARAHHGDRGSASLEFLGILPLLGIAFLAALQLVFAYAAANSTSAAARAAARAVSQGASATAAAEAAVPGWLKDDISVSTSAVDGQVVIRTRGPKVLPLVPDYTVRRSAWFPRTGS